MLLLPRYYGYCLPLCFRYAYAHAIVTPRDIRLRMRIFITPYAYEFTRRHLRILMGPLYAAVMPPRRHTADDAADICRHLHYYATRFISPIRIRLMLYASHE